MVSAVRLVQQLVRSVALARLTALFLLAALVVPLTAGACCAGANWFADALTTTAASADGCCAHDEAPAEDAEGQAPCPCPYPCTPSCAGYLGRAIPQLSTFSLAPPVAQQAAVPALAFEPSNPDPHDILHVPKFARA
jgi:hypothetical protein